MSDTSHLRATAVTGPDGRTTPISTPPRGDEPGTSTVADVPAADGGANSAPSPTQLLLASLAACKTMTATVYARRKQWPLEEARVTVRYAEADGDQPPTLAAEVELVGSLDEEQRERILTVIEKCHVQQIIEARPVVVSQLAKPVQ